MSAILERQPDELPPFPVRRWTLEEYHALIDQGMFEDERVELVEGWIVPRMTRNPFHDSTITFVEETLRPHLPPVSFLRVQLGVTFETSEPEPDLAIVRGPAGRYRKRHPQGDEIALVIEVADVSPAQRPQKTSRVRSSGRSGILGRQSPRLAGRGLQ